MELYEVVREAVNPQMLQLIKDSLVISKDAAYAMNGVPLSDTKHFGDRQCPDSWACYSHPVCEALLLTVAPVVRQVSDKELVPTYSYCRIYWNGAVLEKHTDGASCQYSASLCVDVDPEPWPLYMADTELVLNPGDLVCYRGIDVVHWRKAYTGNQQIQVFLHYVDKNDEHAAWAFDKRPTLGFDTKAAEIRTHDLVRQALAAHQQGRSDDARATCEEALRIEPRQFDAMHVLGVIARQSGQPERALELISQAIEIYPKDPAFYLNLGKTHQDLGNSTAAIAAFESALQLKPDLEAAKAALRTAREQPLGR
ncbi:tetratricopeptide repeat protein [Mycobacterium kansasii]|uniref:Tetratricopeptide repeat family protein n=3 Tax=Mycobacterium kansasii TaxID=1768 RepID=A0A1V3XSD8_MYCKA|nr:tetratricopeptide repeat protein [Mycobacterium kansasii]EUA05204.1 tetratricopeptide repeat family protein [Mycobacterium kansasii 824]AGZ54452.1 hypothetical protein MKAN_24170 [Mycobacterium kansasii ATCC 12478]ARG55322.1 hypothetical protein B1T43_04930 [Mycobacterium kansasii]ARG68460.1 hypothetical protein B1T47_04735 [Mycobacterium kansasii]ARG76900.1 hypothetical protein B1T51_23310 [Mycobacterium kansasii]